MVERIVACIAPCVALAWRCKPCDGREAARARKIEGDLPLSPSSQPLPRNMHRLRQARDGQQQDMRLNKAVTGFTNEKGSKNEQAADQRFVSLFVHLSFLLFCYPYPTLSYLCTSSQPTHIARLASFPFPLLPPRPLPLRPARLRPGLHRRRRRRLLPTTQGHLDAAAPSPAHALLVGAHAGAAGRGRGRGGGPRLECVCVGGVGDESLTRRSILGQKRH